MVVKRDLKILISHGDTKQRAVLGSRLRSQPGITVDVASEGMQALHMLEKNTYDLVILVDNTPDMGGYEIVGLIRTQFPKAKLPIIYMGSSIKRTQDEIYSLLSGEGINEYLTDKSNFNTLVQLLEQYRLKD